RSDRCPGPAAKGFPVPGILVAPRGRRSREPSRTRRSRSLRWREPRDSNPLNLSKLIVDAMQRYGNMPLRVERLVSARKQDGHENSYSAGEPDDPLIGVATEPTKRPRTRLTGREEEAMRTARAQGVM